MPGASLRPPRTAPVLRHRWCRPQDAPAIASLPPTAGNSQASHEASPRWTIVSPHSTTHPRSPPLDDRLRMDLAIILGRIVFDCSTGRLRSRRCALHASNDGPAMYLG